MPRRLRRHTALLALCAMLLRGLIPFGWMPSATGGLALCTAGGMVQLSAAAAADLLGQATVATEEDGTPADAHLLAAPCAFAASAAPGCAPALPALPSALALAGAPDAPWAASAPVSQPVSNALARAPPLASNRA